MATKPRLPRGRPPTRDHRASALYQASRAEAERELRVDLGISDEEIELEERMARAQERGFRHSRARTYQAVTELSPKMARFIALIASGQDEEAARKHPQVRLQRRAIRRLVAGSPLFRAALEGAKTARAAASPA